MDAIQRSLDLLLPQQTHLDHLAVGVIDFAGEKFQSYGDTSAFFDLASVTKVLGIGAAFVLNPETFSPEMRLLAEHRAGLPAWGLLPNPGWQDIIKSFAIQESETLYSDYSAMRVTMEYAKKNGQSIPEALERVWDQEVKFWREVPLGAETPKTGERGGHDIRGDVHDPNAWVIKDWCGHAGLFGTVGGVCRTLLNLQKQSGFLKLVGDEMQTHNRRYTYGWDRVENPANTLAGNGCSKQTFGHLGFTGTSVWIDAERRRGHVILSNATRDGWYCKDGLNEIRRTVGALVWKA